MNAMMHADNEARRVIHEALDDTVIVEAAAGTGKTTELVNRILRVIAEGRARIDEIVAVTFTEKAAGELKLRLRQRLEEDRKSAGSAQAAGRLQAAIEDLEEAHVGTIHGFCADLLRERPVEAGVDPMFRVLTEGQAQRLFNEAFDRWLQRVIEDPPEGVRRSLRRASRASYTGEIDEDGPIERLRRAGFELSDWRDFRTPWTREPFERAAAVDMAMAQVHVLADLSGAPSYAADNLYVDTEPVRRLSRDVRASTDAGDETSTLDGLEGRLVELRRNREFRRARKGSGPTYRKGVTRAQVLAARDALMSTLNDFQIRADADLAAILQQELFECIAEYESLKAREGALDFLDLLLRARNLVRDSTPVRRHFQQRFTRIFVDECQDTDPLQAELLLLLSSNDPDETRWDRVVPRPGKLFIVGDPKQSIYRFRRADVDVYKRVCRLLERAGARRVELRKSFRSQPNIQRLVNAAFEPLMTGDVQGHQAQYVPLARAREDLQGQPSVVVLPVPSPYSHRFVAAKEIERSLPDAVGAYVDWLVTRSGWSVTERRDPHRRIPVEARHVCVLFRRFVSYGEDVTRPYVEALEARGIRHLLVGGRTFHERDEIETLRAAVMAIEWPDDQLSVFATLRGALFALGDEELLEYHQVARAFHPFRVPATLPARVAPVGEALVCLATLHRQRNRVPVADTIATLLASTRAHVGFVLRPGGEQVLANVLHVSELARQYELEGGMSFRGFVEMLHAEAVAGRGAEAPVLEEGTDGVRLMTVHKAKGLEFPIVILADITARLTPFDPGRHIDAARDLCALRLGGWSPKELNEAKDAEMLREQKEGERIAYVAATRARDLLVVPAVGDEPYADGWASPLNAAIYPPEPVRRASAGHAGCPAFKSKDTVLARPNGDPATPRTVCPGAHERGTGDDAYTVVWWSPEPDVLSLGATASFGLRRDDLIVKDVSAPVLTRYLDAYRSWHDTRQHALDIGSTPSLRVSTVTEAALDPQIAFDSVTVTIERVDGEHLRPGGARFGTLVHALLADAPLEPGGSRPSDPQAGIDDRDGDPLDRLAEAHGRLLGANDEEVRAARQIVQDVTSHRLVRDAAQAAAIGRCYREMPITWRTEAGGLIEGTIDLAYEDGDSWVVIDFKTDRELDGALDRYARQVQIYASALAGATGKPARAVLMSI